MVVFFVGKGEFGGVDNKWVLLWIRMLDVVLFGFGWIEMVGDEGIYVRFLIIIEVFLYVG